MVKCAQEKFNLFHLWYDCLCFIGNSVSSMKSKRVGRCTDVLMHYTVVRVSCGQSQSQSNHKLCDRLTAKNAPSCIVKHKNPNQVRIKRGTQFYIVSAKVSFSLHHLAHLNDVVASRRHFTIKWLTIK